MVVYTSYCSAAEKEPGRFLERAGESLNKNSELQVQQEVLSANIQQRMIEKDT